MTDSHFSGRVVSEAGFVGALLGNVLGNVLGDVEGIVYGVVSTLVADGAIPLTSSDVYLDGTSATVAATLADGTAGQTMYVKATNVTNAVTLVPANLADGTTITFTPANEYIVLKFDGANWNVFGGNAAIT